MQPSGHTVAVLKVFRAEAGLFFSFREWTMNAFWPLNLFSLILVSLLLRQQLKMTTGLDPNWKCLCTCAVSDYLVLYDLLNYFYYLKMSKPRPRGSHSSVDSVATSSLHLLRPWIRMFPNHTIYLHSLMMSLICLVNINYDYLSFEFVTEQ